MQIASLINVLSSSPAVLALHAAVQGGATPNAALAGQTPGTNTGSPADALIAQNPALPGQFAGLLTGANVKVAALPIPTEIKTDILTDIAKDTPQGNQSDVAALTQTGSIAVPPIGLYIDQPVNPVVLTKDNAVTDATSGGKKLVFAEDEKLAPTGNPALANELPANPKDGNIKLAGLPVPTDKTAQDPEFAKAFDNIVQQSKDKGAAKPEIQAKVTDVQVENIETKTAATEKSMAATALNQPQQVASKIAAKVLGIKQEKIAADMDITAEMSAKLQNLDAQLRTKNYMQIKAASSTLAQSPVEQVQLKISQAIDSGINNIKINLHPAELGAVDVDMDVDHEGNTSIRIIADKTETLQLLKNDSHNLVKSLSEIGVKADAGSLQFSLRGDSQNQPNFANAQNGSNGNNGQPHQQHVAQVTGNYSRYSNINEQDLIMSINNKALNILV